MHTVEDLDVSATKVSPFERPGLGEWLREPKLHLWDVLVFWRADRAVRSMADMFKLTSWAQKHRKVIVFVSGPFGGDPLTLDLRQDRADPHVNLILAIISFAAEVETQAIKERVNGARAFLLPTDRWAGGSPGYGYKVVDHPVKGKTLAVDEYAAGVIREIAGWLCDGDPEAEGEAANEGLPLTEIARRLNERGELTHRDRTRVAAGKPTRSRGRAVDTELERELWSRAAVKDIMTSPRLLGYKVHKGKPALGPDGAPIKMAAPILTHERFQRVADALDARSRRPSRTRGTTPMLGVIKCGICEGNASRVKSQGYEYYRCNKDGTNGPRCPKISAIAHRVTGIAERAFLSQLRDVRVQVREWDKGEDHTAELDHVRGLRDSLENEKRNSREDWDDEDEARYQLSMRHYRKRIRTLRALPQREAGWRTHLSERTYGQEWADADEDGRRRLMLNAGMVVRINGRLDFTVSLPESTMRAGYPGWEPRLAEEDVQYIAGDTGAAVNLDYVPDSDHLGEATNEAVLAAG